jgi:tetratricopeptide (TPR) repeat protein
VSRIGLACALLLLWGRCAFGAEAEDCRSGAITGQAGIAACTTAIAATPGADKARLLMERAQLLRRAGDLTGAGADLEQALALTPDDAGILVELGYLKRAQGDPEGQLAADAKALAIDPRNWRALLNHMDALASLGRNRECLAEASRALELAAEQAYAYAYRGRCRAGIGETTHAVEDYRKAAGMGLDEAFLYANLALAELDLGQNEAALTDAKAAVKREPTNEYGQYGRIDALLQLGRLDEAIAAYPQAMAAVGKDTLGLANLLAWELYRRGRAADALPIIEGFIRQHPDPKIEQIYEVDTYAHVLAAMGNREEALRQFLAVVDLGGREKETAYRRKLERLKIVAAPGRQGLTAALTRCVELGAGCRLSDSD